ncbi:MAG: VCBS repeat-containing protein [Candidatus Latescibacterota bacterium]|nr:MAG: VCBS repeat-containing protein [Candidatus Latescibacterota bacterium]
MTAAAPDAVDSHASEPREPSAPTNLAFQRVTTGDIVGDGGWSFGHAWGDANGDGCLDLIVCSIVAGQLNLFYRSNCDGTFDKVTGALPVEMGPSTSATWGDFDNDGDADLFVANGGTGGAARNSLYRNGGAGSFTKLTASAPVTQELSSTATSWVDVDRDGRLDLFVGRSGGSNELFLNAGGGTFTRIALPDQGETWGVAWADYDNDGDPDCFAANWGRANDLYRNDDGILVRVFSEPIVQGSHNSVSGSWGDYDNDGDLDLFVANSGARDRLFRNEGGSFHEVLEGAIVERIANSESSCWADFDHDGDLDLVVSGGGNVSLGYISLYENRGDSTFDQITTGELVQTRGRFEGASCVDYDNDGDLDLFFSNYAGLDNVLFRNDGSAGRWVSIGLEGTTSNRSALGARLHLKATIAGVPRWQVREVSAQAGHVAQGDPRVHFGLGDAAVVDTLRIVWPSGGVDVVTDLQVDRFHRIVEGLGPTPVGVRELHAEHTERGVRLTWKLSHGVRRELAGVQVQRARRLADLFESITVAPLIPAVRMSFEDTSAMPGSSSWYRLLLDFHDGSRVLTRAVRANGQAQRPQALSLQVEPTAPGAIRIRYTLAQAGTPVVLEVFDIKGRRVRLLEDSVHDSGGFSVEWDGLDEFGQAVPRGVYVVRLQAGRAALARKAPLLQR